MKTNLFRKFLLSHNREFLIDNSNFFPIKSDASKRSYYRIKLKNENLILMDSSKDKKSLPNFVLISKWLLKNNLSAPQIVHHDTNKGFCLIEDFGLNKFSDYFRKNQSKKFELYKETIDFLQYFSKIKIPNFLKPYNEKEFYRELNLFLKWHVFHNKEINKEKIKLWDNIWKSLFDKLNFSENYSVILRDFHIDNLFFLNQRTGIKKIGLIDYQDALYGHKSYDLVSLLQDVRVFISTKIEQELLNYYLMQEKNKNEFIHAYLIFGTQRLLKIIGVFKRLHYKDKKNEYLKYLPRTWKILKRNLETPILKDLRDWIYSNA